MIVLSIIAILNHIDATRNHLDELVFALQQLFFSPVDEISFDFQ